MPVKILCLLWITIGVLGRLIPHWPNATPLISLCLFSGVMLSRNQASIIMLLTLIISDVVLALWLHYPLFGYWTIFGYSGFLLLTITSRYFSNLLTINKTIFISTGYALLFWIWSNLGVWLTATLYPHTVNGLVECYVAALPFLQNLILSSVICSVCLYYGIFLPQRHQRTVLAKE